MLANMGIFGGVRVLTILCSLVRNKLIAVFIGPTGVGLVILYNSVADLVGTFTRLNIDQSAIRHMAGASKAQTAQTAAVIHTLSMWLAAAGALIMCVLSPLLSFYSFGHTGLWWTFCLLATVPASYSYCLGQQAIMQGTGNLRRLAKSSAWTALGGIVIAIPLIVLLGQKCIVWLIVSYAICNLAAVFALRVRLPHIAMGLRQVWQRGRQMIKLGIWITLGLCAGQLCNYLFILYLNHNATTHGLGLYQSGYMILNNYVIVFLSGIWVEYFPKLTAIVHSPDRVRTVVSHRMATMVWLLMPVSAAFMGCDKLIVNIIYSTDFYPMLPYLTIGMGAMMLRATSWCLAHVILAKGDGHIYLVTESLSGITGLALNTAGYRMGGLTGLGIAFALWYAAYLLVTYTVYRRRYGYRLNRGTWRLLLMGTAFCGVCIAARFLAGWWLPLLLAAAIAPLAWRRVRGR